ncbi:MAG TPA: M20/M25/M40 family metallo-hydrolase, partial [Terriglobales bacterium]
PFSTMKIAAAVLLLSISLFAADKTKTQSTPAPAAATPSAPEKLDLATISRLRDEGLNHTHIMDYASGLFDDVGQRLTGSPEFAHAELWSQEQLRRMGATNVHTETWGEFGMGWEQIGTSLQLVDPAPATFLAQATPWSPATSGEVTAPVIAVPMLNEEKDFDQWKGKLAGKVILYGDAPKIDPDGPKPPEHYDAAKLEHFRNFALDGDQRDSHVLPKDPAMWEKVFKEDAFLEKVARFFADEHAIAVLRAGGTGGVLRDDSGMAMGWWVYRADHRQPIPSASLANEAFGRMHRLVANEVPVTVRLNIATRFTGNDHVIGEDVIAEIPGTDSALKDQIVMVGGHLDSWIAGTGATDDGAGAIIALEAMRILSATGVRPRRTIRIGLWGGEEQGIFGSAGYVANHYGIVTYSTKPEEQVVPDFLKVKAGVSIKPDHAKFDAYFNTDNGGGRFLGIFTEGNSPVADIFQQWVPVVNDLGFTTVTLRNTASTDHVSFDNVGLPGFQFIQDPRDYMVRSVHTNQDVYERLSEPDLKQAATVMAIFLYNTAQRDEMLPRKPLLDPSKDEQRAKPLEGIYPNATKP